MGEVPNKVFPPCSVLLVLGLRKNLSNVCSFFHQFSALRQIFCDVPLPPFPVSVRQNMSKVYFAHLPYVRVIGKNLNCS